MPNTRQLLEHHSIEDLFTIVYTLTDDYLKQSVATQRFELPKSPQQKASYAELMSIAIVGELIGHNNAGAWFCLVRSSFNDLFRTLPDVTRYYRTIRNCERIWADLALCLANTVVDTVAYRIDSKPIAICKLKRSAQPRAMTEAAYGFSTSGGVFGFKLHAMVNDAQMLCRFAIVPANEGDLTVARWLLTPEDDRSSILGDKGYIGLGIVTPSRVNAVSPQPWTRLMGAARQLVETAFSSLARSYRLGAVQLNSFWSVRASVCRKIAVHNLAIWLGL